MFRTCLLIFLTCLSYAHANSSYIVKEWAQSSLVPVAKDAQTVDFFDKYNSTGVMDDDSWVKKSSELLMNLEPGLEEVAYFGKDTKLIIKLPDEDKKLPKRMKALAEQASSLSEVYVTRTMFNRNKEAYVLYVCVPVYKDNSEFMGAIVAIINAATFTRGDEL